MRIEEISEAIEVIVVFQSGKLAPVKFRWRNRIYKVERINGHWSTDVGTIRSHHYAVTTDGKRDTDVFELCYNERRHDWVLEKVSLV
jgi:hypothetical protein